ncbi:hypothetical protein [Salicibibacter kimchii]|uniref:Uncharacterized protein n=1 Tax=Salicibibacter kimchii TaxID=2099786 RepID=A0A345BXR1_9BACI|nr:hypothetical protein [Salicibibacter kimchii]AXF55742.1 hypothetical protein DT065_06700 [Salicibibacter kimchii]
MDRQELWEQINNKSDDLHTLVASYWEQYSHIITWQFWVVASMLILPLILLYFTVDRKRIFEVFFYGYTVHILWSYTSIVLARLGLLVHPYFIIPMLPYGLGMTASAIPVGFLLLYQYCANQNKNFYLSAIILSAFFGFGSVSIESYLGLTELNQGMNLFYIFLINLVIAYIAFWFTKLVWKIKNYTHAKALG